MTGFRYSKNIEIILKCSGCARLVIAECQNETTQPASIESKTPREVGANLIWFAISSFLRN